VSQNLYHFNIKYVIKKTIISNQFISVDELLTFKIIVHIDTIV